MTELIDVYHTSQKITQSYYEFTAYSTNWSIQSTLKKFGIDLQQINSQFYNINKQTVEFLLSQMIDFSTNQVKIIFKLLSPNGNIIRAISQFQRVELMRSCIFNNKGLINKKVHPLSGELSFECSWFVGFIPDNFDFLLEYLQAFYDLIKAQSSMISQVIRIIEPTYSETTQITEFLFFCAHCSNIKGQVKDVIQKQKAMKYQSKSKHLIVEELQKVINKSQCTDKILSDREILEIKNYQDSYLKSIRNEFIQKNPRFMNMQNLTITENKKKIVANQINDQDEKLIRLQHPQQGPIHLSFRLKTTEQMMNTFQKLSLIPKGIEYKFLQTYFKLQNNELSQMLLILARKGCTLSEYLQANLNSISFFTRCKIFSRIIIIHQLLWETSRLLYTQICINNFFITKTFSIKLQNLYKIQYLRLENPYTMNIIDQKMLQTQFNLAQLYFKLFYNRSIIPLKSSKKLNKHSLKQMMENGYIRGRSVIQQINFTKYYGPQDVLRMFNQVMLSYIPHIELQQQLKAKNIRWLELMMTKTLEWLPNA